MRKRWLIRGLFLLPVVLCLAGWGWSGWYEGEIHYERAHRWVGLGTMHGAMFLEGVWHAWVDDSYGARVSRNDSVRFWPQPDVVSICFLGFRWWHYRIGGLGSEVDTFYRLTIPYWFPLLVSSLLLLGAWRKTRSRPDPATAFPVVMKT